ncbi:MAG: hypothetical protein ACOYNI_08050 [Acidimicrobiia bacterium]
MTSVALSSNAGLFTMLRSFQRNCPIAFAPPRNTGRVLVEIFEIFEIDGVVR